MALKYYYKSLELNKSYHYTYLNISAIYIEEKDYEKSIEILTEGIEFNEDAEDLYYNRACCYAILGREDEAIKDLKRALSINFDIIEWIVKDKDFKNLYDNEEFIKLIKKYGGKGR